MLVACRNVFGVSRCRCMGLAQRYSPRLMEVLHCSYPMSWLSCCTVFAGCWPVTSTNNCTPLPPAMSSGSFLTPGSWLTVGPPTPPPPPDIRVNDISVSSQGKDASTGGGQPSPESAKRQWRRSSWCPEQERKKEEKQEYQRSLAVAGRRWSICTFSSECFYSR